MLNKKGMGSLKITNGKKGKKKKAINSKQHSCIIIYYYMIIYNTKFNSTRMKNNGRN